MSLGGLDVLVFTAGIGEHSPKIRAEICESLGFLGLTLDPVKNEQHSIDVNIATAESSVQVWVVHTQENWAIAKDCWQHIIKAS